MPVVAQPPPSITRVGAPRRAASGPTAADAARLGRGRGPAAIGRAPLGQTVARADVGGRRPIAVPGHPERGAHDADAGRGDANGAGAGRLRVVWASGQPGLCEQARQSHIRQTVARPGRSTARREVSFSSRGTRRARSSSSSAASMSRRLAARPASTRSAARCPRRVKNSASVRRSGPGLRSTSPSWASR